MKGEWGRSWRASDVLFLDLSAGYINVLNLEILIYKYYDKCIFCIIYYISIKLHICNKKIKQNANSLKHKEF